MEAMQTATPPSFETVWAALKETDRIVRENAKQIGDLSSRFGDVIECMVAPNLQSKFFDMGLFFNMSIRDVVFYDDKKNALFEVDILLQNGDKAMLVEVKSKYSIDDVKEHIERLEKMRAYADSHSDKRSFLGAVAGVVMPDNVKEFALKQGFFVVQPSGETFNITPPNGKPKEW